MMWTFLATIVFGMIGLSGLLVVWMIVDQRRSLEIERILDAPDAEGNLAAWLPVLRSVMIPGIGMIKVDSEAALSRLWRNERVLEAYARVHPDPIREGTLEHVLQMNGALRGLVFQGIVDERYEALRMVCEENVNILIRLHRYDQRRKARASKAHAV